MLNNQPAQECPPAGEEKHIQDLAARLKAKIIQDHPAGIMRRDAHPKMHGVVKAEFIIEADLPQSLRVGVFREARTFQAWIRFSNADGSIKPDTGRDIRVMAIKLMGVDGEKILDTEKHEHTQDFLLISTNVFLAKGVEEFDGFLKAMTGSLFAKLAFFLTHWRFIGNTLRSMKKFANPLQIRYWSTTPYLFGSQAVKYSAIPRVKVPDTIPVDADDDFLRKAMARQLDKEEAQFDFTVQLQTHPETMPIEDAGCEWSEAVSSFQKVATIKILRQRFDDEKQESFGENLSYTPWHSLPEHRPLGGINRARKVVYQVISTFRHEKNRAAKTEPLDWEI